MYPVLRLLKEFATYRNAPALPITGTHVSHHICWPWDLDMWMELNNGRTLTLYDLGRLPLAKRAGLIDVLKSNKWGLTMAGATIRYRRRVNAFERIEMRSRAVCWDEKFIYIEQSMWKKNGECASHVLYRSAVTDRKGIVTPDRVLSAMSLSTISPDIPDWIAAWITADALRPWPPMQDSVVS
ncbi:acyl-CoA thioesterase [Parasulfitobacter algicola]|uniref:Thioesterase family protein n=1 Tax=Parasulfitobacter algicola TaxID=2614809 RepID=A0ABX2ILE0_9RHOB|nr:acyl-CoA thioesterase [Sulfitobacter algicola]NSX53210.1 thioesterase family protein [Sulfitobacter algicola]